MLNRMLRPQLFHPAFSLVGARHVVPSSPLAFSPVHSPSIILVPCRGAIHRVLFSVPFSVVPARFRRFRAAAGTSRPFLSPFPLFTRLRLALSLVGARHVVPSSPRTSANSAPLRYLLFPLAASHSSLATSPTQKICHPACLNL